MNREIKFRGKRIEDGEWVYGYYHRDSTGDGFVCYYITTDDMYVHEVDPETVGQYTGLKDKNGVEIYEGDVRRNSRGKIYVVKYDLDSASYIGEYINGFDWLSDLVDSECIGNIYEHPHLIGGESDGN